MDNPTPARGGLYGWVQRKPRAAFWTTMLVTLVIGASIGGAAASNGAELDAAKADGLAAKGRLAMINGERDQLREDLDGAKRRADAAEARIKELTARAEVPDFRGKQAGLAHDNDLVDDIGWEIKTVQQVSAAAAPGIVLTQSPKPGKMLKRGQTITLVAAKKPPPKPPEWVTIASFSGAGEKRTDEFKIPSGLQTRISYRFTGDTNAFMTLKRPGDDEFGGDLLFNEIGDFADSTRIYDSGKFYLEVGDGNWAVDIQVFKRPS